MSDKHKTAIIRKEHFNAAHRLHNSHWTDQKNASVFGKCNNPHYHGHNYDLEVRVVGFCDQETGYVMDAKLLSDLIKEKVLDDFDHKNLNLEVDEFKSLNPTAENIAKVIYERLYPHLKQGMDLTITLHETQRNVVEYPAR